MNDARNTIIDKCFDLANTALAGDWTFHNTREALFWYRSILQIDPGNTVAALGSARAYQYIASQPWWHNDLSVAKSAAVRALALAERVRSPEDALEQREISVVRGQIYSAIGQPDLANVCLEQALVVDENYSVTQYFVHFNNIFICPKEDAVLHGLEKAIELATAEASERRLAVAFYFKGFANLLFANYDEAIEDLQRSMKINPRYGSANLALIAATGLKRHKDTFRAVRCFRDGYPNFTADILDYMWVGRSSCPEYHRLLRPVIDIVKGKLGH